MRKYYRVIRYGKWHLAKNGSKTFCGESIKTPHHVTTQGGMRRELFCHKCLTAQAKRDKLAADVEERK